MRCRRLGQTRRSRRRASCISTRCPGRVSGAPSPWLVMAMDFGGLGARSMCDGPDATGAFVLGGRGAVLQVEPFEAQYPVMIEHVRTRIDSGGPGEHRGGLGIDTAIRMLSDGELVVRGDRMVLPPTGRKGGEPGEPGLLAIAPPRRHGRRVRAPSVAYPAGGRRRVHDRHVGRWRARLPARPRPCRGRRRRRRRARIGRARSRRLRRRRRRRRPSSTPTPRSRNANRCGRADERDDGSRRRRHIHRRGTGRQRRQHPRRRKWSRPRAIHATAYAMASRSRSNARGSTGADIERFVHGTTLATNVLLERHGARTALAVTDGFGDILRLRASRVPARCATTCCSRRPNPPSSGS